MSDTIPMMAYLQAFDDHVRRNGYANLPEGEGLLLVLENAARQLGIPHMTDAERPVAEREAAEAVPYREQRDEGDPYEPKQEA